MKAKFSIFKSFIFVVQEERNRMIKRKPKNCSTEEENRRYVKDLELTANDVAVAWCTNKINYVAGKVCCCKMHITSFLFSLPCIFPKDCQKHLRCYHKRRDSSIRKVCRFWVGISLWHSWCCWQFHFRSGSYCCYLVGLLHQYNPSPYRLFYYYLFGGEHFLSFFNNSFSIFNNSSTFFFYAKKNTTSAHFFTIESLRKRSFFYLTKY